MSDVTIIESQADIDEMVRDWRCYVLRSGDRYREVESGDPKIALLS